VIGRIMAAAAMGTSVTGRIMGRLQFGSSGFNAQWAHDDRSYRPFRDADQPQVRVLPASEPILSGVLKLMARSRQEEYFTAKDDFRLLALDTVEDSRRPGLIHLQYAQFWMAIERLMPFREQTTVQLALALSAFFPAADRVASFKQLKDDYALRSRIVHGYSFRRDNTIWEATQRIIPLFRRAFRQSLSVASSEEFRALLLDHVLNGEKNALA